MVNYREAVYRFLSDKNYFFKPGVMGIFMASYSVTDFCKTEEDVSLYIIMKENVFELTRGTVIENDIKIKYSEININEIYDTISKGEDNCNGIHLPLICSSSIVYDEYKVLGKLQEFIIERQNRNLSLMHQANSNDIYKQIIQLQLYAEEDRKEFDYVYFTLIEKIRKLYSEISGCADIPLTAVLKIYNDEMYRFQDGQTLVPDSEFISVYLQAIYSNANNIEKIKIIKKLYFYSIRDIDIDFNHYLVYLRDKKVI